MCIRAWRIKLILILNTAPPWSVLPSCGVLLSLHQLSSALRKCSEGGRGPKRSNMYSDQVFANSIGQTEGDFLKIFFFPFLWNLCSNCCEGQRNHYSLPLDLNGVFTMQHAVKTQIDGRAWVNIFGENFEYLWLEAAKSGSFVTAFVNQKLQRDNAVICYTIFSYDNPLNILTSFIALCEDRVHFFH